VLDGDLRQLLLAAGLCNNARLLPPENEATRWTILGDPTEAALKVVALKAGLDLEAEERELPRLRELPFESRRKRMSTIHGTADRNARPKNQLVYVKGAPKEVLDLCTHAWLDERRSLDEAASSTVAANDEYPPGLACLAWPAAIEGSITCSIARLSSI
jgi:magnesium-transporting ATPase (P-type)